MSDRDVLTVQSHRGPYEAVFVDDPFPRLAALVDGSVFVIDRRVAELYRDQLEPVFRTHPVLTIEAVEPNKNLDRCPEYIEELVRLGFRRDSTLVGVGGGIIQDIACFIASVLYRGVAWEFYPTTLLAQADSCIGSKSSISVRSLKNAVGTFHPPQRVWISSRFLDTLESTDMRSGIGEMLKVHAIDGPEAFDRIAAAYDRLLEDRSVLDEYVQRSLRIKQRLIEIDEFDRGERQVLNYGHSFGHALELATDFAIPHGIAVTVGMDIANHVAVGLGRMMPDHHHRMRSVLRRNAGEFWDTHVPVDALMAALSRDKKNVGKDLTLILPESDAVPRRVRIPNDNQFRNLVQDYFDAGRSN